MLIQKLSLIRQTRTNQLEGVTSCKAISSSTPRSMPVFNSFVAQQGALGGRLCTTGHGNNPMYIVLHCNMTDQLSNKVGINTFIVSAFYPEVSHYTKSAAWNSKKILETTLYWGRKTEKNGILLPKLYEAGCLAFQKNIWFMPSLGVRSPWSYLKNFLEFQAADFV